MIDRKSNLRELLKRKKLDIILVYSSSYDGAFNLALNQFTPALFNYYYITLNEEGLLEIDYLMEETKSKFHGKILPLRESSISEDITAFLKKYNNVGVIGNAPFWHLQKVDKKIEDLNDDAKKILIEKTPKEIEEIKKAANLISKHLDLLKPHISPGKTQEEIIAFLRKSLTDYIGGFSFLPSLTSGEDIKNTTVSMPSNKKILDKDIIIIDAGVILRGFSSDCTRMYFINYPEAEENYLKLIQAHKEVISSLKPGIYLKEISEMYKKELQKVGLPAETLEIKDLGHSIGFKVHEEPIFYLPQQKDEKLVKNMIITLEPEIKLKDYKLRVEDMILITDRAELLT